MYQVERRFEQGKYENYGHFHFVQKMPTWKMKRPFWVRCPLCCNTSLKSAPHRMEKSLKEANTFRLLAETIENDDDDEPVHCCCCIIWEENNHGCLPPRELIMTFKKNKKISQENKS